MISLQLRRIGTCMVGEDRTHGFFVAVFERSSCAVGEAQTALPPPMRCPAAFPKVSVPNGGKAKESKKKKKKKKKKKEKLERIGEETASTVTSKKRSLEESETNAADAVGVDLAAVSAYRGDLNGATASTRTQRKNRARREQKKRQKIQATAAVQDATGR